MLSSITTQLFVQTIKYTLKTICFNEKPILCLLIKCHKQIDYMQYGKYFCTLTNIMNYKTYGSSIGDGLARGTDGGAATPVSLLF